MTNELAYTTVVLIIPEIVSNSLLWIFHRNLANFWKSSRVKGESILSFTSGVWKEPSLFCCGSKLDAYYFLIESHTESIGQQSLFYLVYNQSSLKFLSGRHWTQ
jgi:hypothetical protein